MQLTCSGIDEKTQSSALQGKRFRSLSRYFLAADPINLPASLTSILQTRSLAEFGFSCNCQPITREIVPWGTSGIPPCTYPSLICNIGDCEMVPDVRQIPSERRRSLIDRYFSLSLSLSLSLSCSLSSSVVVSISFHYERNAELMGTAERRLGSWEMDVDKGRRSDKKIRNKSPQHYLSSAQSLAILIISFYFSRLRN